MTNEEVLKHIGILGMKWGHRKGSNSSPYPKDRLGRSIGSKDHRAASRIKKKRLKDMTNEELKILTTRMGLEKQYRDLKFNNSSPAARAATGILGSAGKQFVSRYIADGMRAGSDKLWEIIKDRRKG